jgi:SAM-dependent methyltransferase
MQTSFARRQDAAVTAIPPDYDDDPERWASHDRAWLLDGDAHEAIADRIIRDHLSPVLDVGCGHGRLRDLLPDDVSWVGLDASPAQLVVAPRPAVRATGTALPFGTRAFAAVAAIWTLHHFDLPEEVIAEARRVVRPGGVFFAVAGSRFNDPELVGSYPPTPFDAEEAPAIVESVFGRDVEVVAWDAPLVNLPDEDAIDRYCRSHRIDRTRAKTVHAPLTLTKRGCVVIAKA